MSDAVCAEIHAKESRTNFGSGTMAAIRPEVHVGSRAETPVALNEFAADNEDVLATRPMVVNVRPLRSGIHFNHPKPQTVATFKSATPTTGTNRGQRNIINVKNG
jgi:hypothetical protein